MKRNHGTSDIVPIVGDSKYSKCFTDVFTKEGEYRMHEGSLINLRVKFLSGGYSL